MGHGRYIFRLLTETREAAADDALLGALKSADLPTGRAIIETLLVRQQRRGLRGLVMALHLLDDTLCQRLLGESERLFGVLREAAQSRDEQVRLNVLALIRRGRLYRAAYLLDGAFHDRSSRVREVAAETLFQLADEILKAKPALATDQVPTHLPPEEIRARMAQLDAYAEDRRQLAGAVEAGLMSYDLHHQASVIEAAMWLVDDLGAKFWSPVTAPGTRQGPTVLRIFGREPSPRLVPFAMQALHHSQFRPHVAQFLGHCTDSAFLDEWLRQSWRLVQPKHARAMSAVKDLAYLDNHAMELLHVSSEARRRIPRWVMPLGLPLECKIDLFKQLQRQDDEDGRRAVAWALTEWSDPVATDALRVLAGSPEGEASRIARYELVRRRPLEYPLSQVMPADPTALGTTLTPLPTDRPISFERYWAAFDRLTAEEREQFGQEMLARTPTAHALLTRQLAAPAAHDRARAITVIKLLNLVPSFAERIYQLSHDSQAEVRSAAVAACAKLPNATTRQILHKALYDRDTRVQANAVEAVDQAGGKGKADELLPKLASPDNRVRANAVRALLKAGVREAAETLLRMLTDRDRAQRVSALWLIEQMGLFTLTTRIARMAACDDDVVVRHRAQNMIERLNKEPADDSPAEVAVAVAPPAVRRPEVATP